MPDNRKNPEPAKSEFNLVDFIDANAQIVLFGLLLLSSFIVFKDFILLNKLYLFKDIGSDSVNYTYPWLIQTSDAIHTQGVPSWTFKQGMGQNAYPLSFGDFFLNALMFLPKNSIGYGIAFAEILKLILAGLVFFRYLRQLNIQPYVSLIGGFLYAFSGYIVLGGCWALFSLEALYAALILYGFEKWLSEKKWLWLTIGIALLSFLQPFFLFMYLIFLLAYGLLRYYNVNNYSLKGILPFALKTIGFASIGVFISSVQLFPVLLQYIESPRVGGEAGLSARLKSGDMFAVADETLRFTSSMRLFSSDMIGTGSDFKGWSNYLEAPLFYCGILSLVSFAQAFTFFTKKQRTAYLIFATLFFIPMIFPYFRHAFWAFTGDYYRTFSLVITLILLFFSIQSLDLIIRNNKVNITVLVVTVLFLLFLLFGVSSKFNPAVNGRLRSFAVFFILAYAAIIWSFGSKGKLKDNTKIILLLLIFVEGAYFSYVTINKRSVITTKEFKSKVGYNDYTVEAVDFIKSNDKNFHRINKDYSSGPAIHSSINDAKVQDFYGTPSYHSFNQKNYIKFLGDLGIVDTKDENSTRWAKGLNERPLVFSIASGKYWLSKQPQNYLQGFGYDSVAMFNDVKVYKNRYAVNFGYCYDMIIDEDTFKKLSPLQKDLALLRACVVEKDQAEMHQPQFKTFDLKDTIAAFSFNIYDSLVKKLNTRTLTVTDFKENNIRGNITTPEPEILFFSIPFDEGWKATINNSEVKLLRVNCGMTGLLTTKGANQVELSFTPRYRNTGFLVSVISLVVLIGLYLIGRRKAKHAEVV